MLYFTLPNAAIFGACLLVAFAFLGFASTPPATKRTLPVRLLRPREQGEPRCLNMISALLASRVYRQGVRRHDRKGFSVGQRVPTRAIQPRSAAIWRRIVKHPARVHRLRRVEDRLNKRPCKGRRPNARCKPSRDSARAGCRCGGRVASACNRRCCAVGQEGQAIKRGNLF